MHILLACEYYWPSVGGVQKVMRELARRLVRRGHRVQVATSRLENRTSLVHEGVEIVEFNVSGNLVRGMGPDVEQYRSFLRESTADVFMVKAAQQWTFDAALPVLEQMPACKVHIPCGLSGLFLPKYTGYYAEMPKYLRLFDALIYYSDHYYDIDFARQHGITNTYLVPNGACEEEFATLETSFRRQHGIAEQELLLLTVGAPIRDKGHGDCLEAFARTTFNQPATLALIGPYNGMRFNLNLFQRILYRFKRNKRYLVQFYEGLRTIELDGDKRVMMLELDRPQTLEAFTATDLFLFASHVEYSPLVLFESAAAGTPFLSVEVGNSREIADWTECGTICPPLSRRGPYVVPDVAAFSAKMEELCREPQRLAETGLKGRQKWQNNYTWDHITSLYETIFQTARRSTH